MSHVLQLVFYVSRFAGGLMISFWGFGPLLGLVNGQAPATVSDVHTAAATLWLLLLKDPWEES